MKKIMISLLAFAMLCNYHVVLAVNALENQIHNPNTQNEILSENETNETKQNCTNDEQNENAVTNQIPTNATNSNTENSIGNQIENVTSNEINQENNSVHQTENVFQEITNNSTVAEPKNDIAVQDSKNNTQLANGTYSIATILKNKPSFDITDGSFQSGAKIQLWDYLSAEQQKFDITADKNGFYEIKSVYTGKVLATQNKNVQNGMAIIQKVAQGTDDEKWIIQKETDDSYSIHAKTNTAMVIDIADFNAVNGLKLQMHTQNYSTAQRFTFTTRTAIQSEVANGFYAIQSHLDESQYWDITDGRKDNGNPLQVWSYLGAFQQKFTVEHLTDGYYKIVSAYSEKALTVSDTKNVIGSSVIQEEYTDKDTQKWILKRKSDQHYVIVSKIGDYAIELKGRGDGAKLVMNQLTGTKEQNFSFQQKRTVQPTQSVANGIYKIETILKNKPAFDITDGSKEDGAKIQLWDYLNADQQKFKFTCDAEGYYEIMSIYTGKVLAIDNLKAQNGAQIIQKTKQGTDDEKWIIQKEDNGTYSLNTKINFSSIEVSYGDAVNGKKVSLYEWNNWDTQKFTLTKEKNNKIIEEGTYKITMFTQNNIALDVDCGKRENGANVQLWEWFGEKSYQQQFQLVYHQSSGTYTIYNINSGKVLDVQNGGRTPGTNVWLYEENGTDAQKWIIDQREDGSYSIQSKLNGLYLDIYYGKLVNGTNVQLFWDNGADAQKFKFEKLSDRSIRYLPDGLYRIAAKYNNVGFDIKDGSKADGAPIQLWEYINATQEEFHVYYEDGYYYIRSLYSDKVVQAGNIHESLTQQTYNSNSDLQKWIMQPSQGAYHIISKATGLYIDVADCQFTNGNKVQTHYGNGNDAQLFEMKEIGVAIDEKKYPGIKERINALKLKHPNWRFQILYTTLDFHTAVQSEYDYEDKKGNFVWTPTYYGDWIAPNAYVSGNWASASYAGIAYFMDPRNFLNEEDIFQFADLGNYAASGATIDGIQKQVNDSFLQDFATDVKNACENVNINPYFVIARLFQEQSRNGSGTIYMDGGDGKQYFNPFNIGAVVGKDYETALAKAKECGWDTMQKGLEGGINLLKNKYINKQQHILYLNKFDVNPASNHGFYGHQYMQNVSAAYSEAHTFRSAYINTGTLDNTIQFVIPVYENMPAEVAARPSGGTDVDPTADRVVVKTSSGIGVKVRNKENPDNVIVKLPDGTKGTRIATNVLEYLGFSWDEVRFDNGVQGIVATDYLQKAN